MLRGEASPRDRMFYYRGQSVWAARLGPWKAHFMTKSGFRDDPRLEHDPPLLYHLEHDPSEKYNLADENADVIERIRRMVEEHRRGVKPVKDQLAERTGVM